VETTESADATAESMATSEPDTRINAAAAAAAKTFMVNLIGLSRVLGDPRLRVADFQLLIYINCSEDVDKTAALTPGGFCLFGSMLCRRCVLWSQVQFQFIGAVLAFSDHLSAIPADSPMAPTSLAALLHRPTFAVCTPPPKVTP
jgi:hypothetical protein